MDIVEAIFERMQGGAARRYGTDHVNVLSHSIQCALQAERAGAPDALIAAALLHDIGHMVNPDARAARDRGEDARHEATGETLLSEWFDEDVTRPVFWHVAAKRYLTAVEPDYLARLSAVSRRTLQLQGGPFTDREASDFIAQPYAMDGVALRRWDEAAKDPTAEIPDLTYFASIVQAALKPAFRTNR